MAINDFNTLQIALANWLAREDLEARLPEFIQLGEERLRREVRTREMEELFSVLSDPDKAPLPAEYLELKFMYLDKVPVNPLKKRTVEWIYTHYPDREQTGNPEFVAREAAFFIFGPAASTDLTFKGIYYKAPAPLSVDNLANLWVLEFPTLILYASLSEAAPYLGEDDRILVWEGKYATAKERVMLEHWQEYMSGGSLEVTTS